MPRPGLGLALLVVCIPPRTAAAQQPVRIAKLTIPIAVDGRVDESEWRSVPVLPLTTFLPVAGNHPTDSSEVRLAYDDKYLYASARFFVSSPAEIQSTTLTRDQLGADDRFRIMLDTYNDNRTGVGFLVTPNGVRCDYDMTDDGATVDDSWNTYWDAATSRDAKGWYAEIRIPWSSLRFSPVNGQVTMGLIALRVSVKKNEWSTFPALSPRYANAIWRASVAQKIVFDGVRRRSPTYLIPYALGNSGRTAQLAADGGGYGYNQSQTMAFGGDVKYGLTDNLTLDATVNTDFAQAEADNQQVNLTRFSLFFPEKRQFFLERAGSFDFNTSGDGSNLFYSRRIGLSSNGMPLQIYGGARVVGRAGPFDVGALDLQVATDSNGSTENVGVVRVHHRLINDGTYLGGILTTRLRTGRHNIVFGTDAQVKPFGNDYISAEWAHSFDDSAGSGAGASQARLEWARRSSKGLIYFVDVKWSGHEFDPGLGFESHQDYTRGAAEVDYKWIGKSGYSLQPSLFAFAYRRNKDHQLDTGQLYPYVDFGLPSGLHGWVAWRGYADNPPSDIALSPAVRIPAGLRRYQQGEIYLVSPPGARLGYTLLSDVGSFYDGRQTFIDFTPTWALSGHLTVGGEYQFNRVWFSTRDEYLNADVARLKIQTAWNTKLSAETFLQYNSVGALAVGNVRVRYQFSEGTDLYLVYNDQLNVNRSPLVPNGPELPLTQSSTLIVKLSRTFIE